MEGASVSVSVNYPALFSSVLLTVNVLRKICDPNQGEDPTKGILKCLRNGSSSLWDTVSALSSRYVLEFKKQDIPLMGKVLGDSHSNASRATAA